MNKLIDQIIHILNLEESTVKGNELWARCPNPAHPDFHPSWSLNLDTGQHFCFSCGYKGHIVSLLSGSISLGRAKLLWNQLRRITIDGYTEGIKYPITEEMVDPWTRKIAKEAVQRVGTWTVPQLYGVGEDPITGRAAFITRDRGGRPTGVWVANLNPKYVLLGPVDAKSRGALFGAHVRPSRQTVVVEGFYQAMAVARDTGLKAVATMGTSITDQQLQELILMAPILIMMDGDRPGREARDSLISRFPVGVEVWACGGYIGDPDEMTSQQLWKIIKTAKHRHEYQNWKDEKENT